MYAVVEIAGKQFKVVPNQQLVVPTLEQEAGASIALDKVLLTDDGEHVQVGTPLVDGSVVKAKVIGHAHDEKILVFKKKRRKGYKKIQGHRQGYTKLLITDIVK